MILAASSSRLFLFALFSLIFDFCCAHPSPDSNTWAVFPRQQESPLTSPVTLNTTQTITTDIGTFIQTCTITLTPIVVNGQDMVREEKACEVTPANGNSSALPPPATSTSTSDSLSSTSGVPSGTVPPDSTVTTSLPESSGSIPPPVVSTTLTFVPQPTNSNSVSLPPASTPVASGLSSVPSPTATPQAGNGNTSTSLPSSPLPLSQSPSTPTVSPTASAENAGDTFDPPGKKLEVLPIGLGVFAGVSVIALFVVGIVTYERTKHRRNFRRRREQEANNRMGYGTV